MLCFIMAYSFFQVRFCPRPAARRLAAAHVPEPDAPCAFAHLKDSTVFIPRQDFFHFISYFLFFVAYARAQNGRRTVLRAAAKTICTIVPGVPD
jgi:hypothetical protein